MPSINRIRIFNVSFDNRHIKDCLFDMYGGADTLLNLSNGGGKSVMVQLIFQPIIPGTQLDKRRITDYMPKNSTPIHIMIEWLLDNTKEKQYLLTGICMGINKSERNESDEQGNVNYRYFTYTHTYKKGNEYDIGHFPLKDDNGRIFSYDAVFDKLKRVNRTDFCVFPKNRLNEYKKELERYCIYQGEWLLLQKINQHEGGLINLFKDCTTSDKLFDDWILKTVSDCMPDARSSLIQMISGLVQPMIESKDDIREKELLERLSADVQQFMQGLNDYWYTLDEKERKERFFCGARNFERAELKKAEIGREAAEQAQQDCKAEEKHINNERISEEIINCQAEKCGYKSELEKAESELPKAKAALDAITYRCKCMDAARLYEDMRSWKDRLNAARSVIETLEKGENGTRLRNIGYTLYTVYSEQSDEYYRESEEHEKELLRLNDEEKSLREKTAILQKDRDNLGRNIAVLEGKCEDFLEEEEKYRELIGRLPHRNLLSELVAEDVSELRQLLSISCETAEKSLSELNAESVGIKQKQECCEAENRQLHDEILRRNTEKSKAETALDNCEKELGKIKDVLIEYDIDCKYLFDREYNLNLLNEKATAIKTNHDRLLNKRERKNETLERFNKKQLHISHEFAELLEKNGIEYQTGEDFLSMQPTEYINMLLSENDMLPYCFIISDSDYDKVLSIDSDITVDRICPVVKRSSIGRKISLPNVRFYSLYNIESIDVRTSKGYGRKLEEEIRTLSDNIKELEKAKEKCHSARIAVSNFGYTSEAYTQLRINFENAKKSLEDSILKKKENESERKNLADRLLLLDKEIETAKENFAYANEKLNCYDFYIKLAEDDFRKRAELKELSGKLEQVSGLIDEYGEKMSKISDMKIQKSKAESECKSKGRNMAEKASRYASYESGEFINATTEQLESEYSELSVEFSGSRQHQENICREADTRIKKLSDDLADEYPELSEADYSIIYSHDELVRLKAENEVAGREYSKLEGRKKQAESSLKEASERLERRMAELKRYGIAEPLSESEIKGNYTIRLEECSRRLDKAKIDEENFRKYIRYHERRITELEKLISDGTESSENIPLISENIDIPHHKSEFASIKSLLAERKRNLRKLCNEIKNIYSDEDDLLVKTFIDRIDFDDIEDSATCYYLYEQLDENIRRLNDEIKRLQSDLSHIAESEQHIIRQVYEHGQKLYSEVMSIFKNSYEKLQEEKGRHRIMEIDIDDSPDSQAERRVADFVSSELMKLCNEATDENENRSKLMNRVSKIFSDRLIFNAIANKSTYRIKVYKVNENAANSRLENWESVYSGGERFVTYFIMFAALTSYARKNISGDKNGNSKSVFLSDNPFGATSSEHLLDVLVKITQKYKLQLICFTALKQRSIANEFDLIYQLAMRQAMYSNNSYLILDDVEKKAELIMDSNLEYISLKSSSDQMSFF